MKHLLKPVDAMKLKGRVTVGITVSEDSTVKAAYISGKAIQCDWWPFAWPLLFERRTAISVAVTDPVTGRLVMWCDGISDAEAIKDAACKWDRRKGGMVNLTKLIFGGDAQ